MGFDATVLCALLPLLPGACGAHDPASHDCFYALACVDNQRLGPTIACKSMLPLPHIAGGQEQAAELQHTGAGKLVTRTSFARSPSITSVADQLSGNML